MGAAITFGMDRATERRMEGQGRTVFHDLVGRVYVVAIGGPRSTWLPAGEALHLQQEEHTPAGDAMPAGAVRRPWMAPRRPWMAATEYGRKDAACERDPVLSAPSIQGEDRISLLFYGRPHSSGPLQCRAGGRWEWWV